MGARIGRRQPAGGRPMMFEDWSAFAAMGGHGLYVWLAYAAALLLLAVNVLKLRADRRRTLRLLGSQAAEDDASAAP